jgi:c-di-GMP-binding flagellar brake protein YcgR
MNRNAGVSTDERRRSKRFDLPIEIEYRTLTQNPIYGNVLAENISKTGIALAEAAEVKRGETIQLRMNVPGDNLPVFATGTVAWADGVKAGVRITKISKNDQERILEHIYQNWLKGQRLARPSTR